MFDPRLRTALQLIPSSLRCPSVFLGQRAYNPTAEFLGIPVGVTSYQGVLGDIQLGGTRSRHVGTLPDVHNLANCNGLFFRLSYQNPQRFASVTDGSVTRSWSARSGCSQQPLYGVLCKRRLGVVPRSPPITFRNQRPRCLGGCSRVPKPTPRRSPFCYGGWFGEIRFRNTSNTVSIEVMRPRRDMKSFPLKTESMSPSIIPSSSRTATSLKTMSPQP